MAMPRKPSSAGKWPTVKLAGATGLLIGTDWQELVALHQPRQRNFRRGFGRGAPPGCPFLWESGQLSWLRRLLAPHRLAMRPRLTIANTRTNHSLGVFPTWPI